MGEAKRRRDYERDHVDELAADLALRRERFAIIEEIAGTDPEDLDGSIDARLRELNTMIDG